MSKENMEKYLTTGSCKRITIGDLKWEQKLTTDQLLKRNSITVQKTVNGNEINQTLLLGFTKVHFGLRVWFSCPGCDGRRGVLYLPPPYSERFMCTECWNLIYPSQAFHRLKVYEMIEKYSIKQARIKAKLQNEYLRKSTKERLFNEYRRLCEKALPGVYKLVSKF